MGFWFRQVRSLSPMNLSELVLVRVVDDDARGIHRGDGAGLLGLDDHARVAATTSSMPGTDQIGDRSCSSGTA
jgi:hypothetical protein